MKYTAILLSLTLLVSCSSSGSKTTEAPQATKAESAPEAAETIPDSEIGLAAGTAFEQPEQKAIEFNFVDPGEGEIQARPNAEFPPVIPHSIQDLGPITMTENPCRDCHNSDVAEEMGTVALPDSHRMDLRNSPGVVGDELTGARFVCTSCHVEVTG